MTNLVGDGRREGPIVGRDAELSAVEAAISSAERGPVGVLISGEAGIGKSAFLRALGDRLDANGWWVASAEADALERQIPFAALGRLLGLLGSHDATFGEVCGRAITTVGDLLEDRRVALLVDDVDVLDDDSLALLAILVRRLSTDRLVIAGAGRTDVPRTGSRLGELVRRLGGEATLHQMSLRALTPEDVAVVVRRVIGATPEEALAREVHDRADGNPFFAREIASALRQAGELEVEGDSAKLAAGAQVMRVTPGGLLERIAPFEPELRHVLEAVAVLGRAALSDVPLLSRMIDRNHAAVGAALDELVAAGVLAHTADAWAFTHDLVREAVYDGIGPARQRLMHGEVASALLAERAAGRAVDVLTVARHVSISADVSADLAAAALLTEAADLTRGVAPRSSAELYQRALDVLPADSDHRGSVLARRCRALSLAGNPVDAVAAGTDALSRLAAGEERARCAVVVVNGLVELGRLEEALELACKEATTTKTPALVVERARLQWMLGQLDEALADAHEADGMSTASKAERTLVLGPLSLVASYTHQPRPVPAIAAEMVGLAPQLPPTVALYARVIAAYALATCGYVAAASPVLEEAESRLDETGGTAFRGNLLVARVFVDWLSGRWDEAAEGIEAALVELEGASYAVQASGLHAIELAIRSARGEPINDDLLRAHAPVPNFGDLHAWAVAGVLLASNRLDDARAVVVGALDRGRGVAYRPQLLARRIAIDARAGAQPSASDALAQLEDELEQRPHPWTRVVLNRSRASLLGDAGAARAAVEAAESGGFVVERALAQLTLAELDDGDDAAGELMGAYRTFQSMRADPWRRQAAALLRSRNIPVPRQRAPRAGVLTDAEMKIAQLVQQGMRNREIAGVLHYSPRTVEVYLSRIYAKLAVSSRLELARRLDELNA